MAKKRIACPECGHHHTITVSKKRVTRASVRASKLPGSNRFEYTMTADPEMIDAGAFTSVTDDITLAGAVGIAAGALCGACASIVAPDYAIEIIGAGASGGALVAWGWLCAEYNTRLKRVVPWFVAQRDNWQSAGVAAKNEAQGVQLTIDHRYRDSHTETGRTTEYFGVLPVDIDRFNEYVQAALRGDSLAIAQWTGSGALFSRSEYDKLLDLLRNAGTVVNVPGKGNQVTGAGRRALTRHMQKEGLKPPPSPQKKDFLGDRLAQATRIDSEISSPATPPTPNRSVQDA